MDYSFLITSPPVQQPETFSLHLVVVVVVVVVIFQRCYLNASAALLHQGVVTYMSCVEAFVTGIKIESSDQSPL